MIGHNIERGTRQVRGADESPARVLIVDDNLGLAENIAEILEGEGHATDIASSAEEALPKVLTRTFGVVVTDFRLPGMNGIDLIRTVRQHGMNVVAIVISAVLDERTAEAAQLMGARFLEKPLDFVNLRRCLSLRKGSG
jgi:DNA-binding NtrC family response regulator